MIHKYLLPLMAISASGELRNKMTFSFRQSQECFLPQTLEQTNVHQFFSIHIQSSPLLMLALCKGRADEGYCSKSVVFMTWPDLGRAVQWSTCSWKLLLWAKCSTANCVHFKQLVTGNICCLFPLTEGGFSRRSTSDTHSSHFKQKHSLIFTLQM